MSKGSGLKRDPRKAGGGALWLLQPAQPAADASHIRHSTAGIHRALWLEFEVVLSRMGERASPEGPEHGHFSVL